MRTRKEIAEALLNIRQAMTACPVDEREESSYAMAEHFCLLLSWVLEREEGKPFEVLIDSMKAVDDAMEKILREALEASLAGAIKGKVQ